MMDFQQFVGASVTNKRGEKGRILSYKEPYFEVEVQGTVKTFQAEMLLAKGFFSFDDAALNQMATMEANQAQNRLEEEAALEAEKEHQVRLRNAKALKGYKLLKEKNEFMKHYFGESFQYPPYQAFRKVFGPLVGREKTWQEELFAPFSKTPYWVYYL